MNLEETSTLLEEVFMAHLPASSTEVQLNCLDLKDFTHWKNNVLQSLQEWIQISFHTKKVLSKKRFRVRIRDKKKYWCYPANHVVFRIFLFQVFLDSFHTGVLAALSYLIFLVTKDNNKNTSELSPRDHTEAFSIINAIPQKSRCSTRKGEHNLSIQYFASIVCQCRFNGAHNNSKIYKIFSLNQCTLQIHEFWRGWRDVSGRDSEILPLTLN